MAGRRKKCNNDVPGVDGIRPTAPADYLPLTDAEFRLLLLRTRDNAARWLDECTEARIGGGTGAARVVLECVCAQLREMDAETDGGRGGVVELRVNGFDVHKMQFGTRGGTFGEPQPQ